VIGTKNKNILGGTEVQLLLERRKKNIKNCERH